MTDIQLTVIIPVFNEKNTIEILLQKVLNNEIVKQIIVVDDYSKDGTREIITKKFGNKIDKIILHENNLGKGATIKSAQKYAVGKYTIIQDADLEYDPADYKVLLNEAEQNNLDVVYGSRVLKKNMYTNMQNFSHRIRIWGNLFLTFLNNMINNQKLTDAHTCYKLFKTSLFKSIHLAENDFSFCPEITTKLSNLNIKINEVSISYTGRTYDDGKKMQAADGLKAIWVLLKYKYFEK